MKQSAYKSFDDLPLYLNADMIADLLGISHAGTYELMHEKDFPVLRIGSRMVVPLLPQSSVPDGACRPCRPFP